MNIHFGNSNQSDSLVSDWLVEYEKIVRSYNITDKTISNKLVSIKWIKDNLGNSKIGHIKPYEISSLLKIEYANSPSKAKRVLIETKNMFKEAVIYGWIYVSPAIYIKSLPAPTVRERLSFDDWESMYECSKLLYPKWAQIMLLLALVTGQRRSDLVKMKYSDIKDGNLLVNQQKTNIKIAIPLSLRLNVIDMSIGEVIEMSRTYNKGTEYMIRKSTGDAICPAYMSAMFAKVVVSSVIDKNTSLHECRSLAERLYRDQGINTRLLLGHLHQRTTDMYNDARGLNPDFYTTIPV